MKVGFDVRISLWEITFSFVFQDFTSACNFDNQEVYILGDLNINLSNTKKHLPNRIKCYQEFCLKQLINAPTRIAQSSLSPLDHVLTNSSDQIPQASVVDVSLSDHQLIYCTRKVTQARFKKHKYIKTRSKNWRNWGIGEGQFLKLLKFQ